MLGTKRCGYQQRERVGGKVYVDIFREVGRYGVTDSR